MKSTTQEGIMRESGYVTAAIAADTLGYENVGTVHRAIKEERFEGLQSGRQWYVKVESMLEAFKDVPPIADRIKKLQKEMKTNGKRT